ncbi:MAG: hypothetical protein QOH97_3973 [Actinoplanes sp.]|nr:hypothetical protein [Actinoplanes sp.]
MTGPRLADPTLDHDPPSVGGDDIVGPTLYQPDPLAQGDGWRVTGDRVLETAGDARRAGPGEVVQAGHCLELARDRRQQVPEGAP